MLAPLLAPTAQLLKMRSTPARRRPLAPLAGWLLLSNALLPTADCAAGDPAPAPPPVEAPPVAPTGAPPATEAGAGPASGTEAGAPPIPGIETRVLSLDAAVQAALRQNPTLEEAAAAIRRAEAVVAEARSLQLPRLDGSAAFAIQGPIPTFSITQPSSDPNQPPITREVPFGRTFTRSFGVTGSYNVDLFGRFRENTRAARSAVNVNRGGFFTTQNELVFAVQNVYLAALRSRALVSVSREAVEAAGEQLRVAQAGLRAGTSPQFDVLRASVQVSNNRQTLVTAEANYRRTVASLAELVSLEPAVRLELVPVALPPEPEQVAIATARQALELDRADPQAIGPAPTPTTITTPANEPASLPQSLETALAEAFTRRPEVYRAEWARRVAESRVRIEQRGNLPSIGLGASYNFNPDQAGLAVVQQTYSIIANVAVPIWDAGLARARTRQARADVAAAAAQLRGARNNVVEEVKRALVDLDEARERRRAAVANTAQAREALRISQVRYTAGLAPTVEVTDAEVALTQARTNEVNAAYDHVAALANLNRSLGRYASETLALLPK